MAENVLANPDATARGRGRICFVVATSCGYPPAIGGLAVAAYRIVQYLRDAGFDVHVVTGGPTTLEQTRGVEDGVTVHRVVETGGAFERIFSLHRYIRQLDAEVDFDLFNAFFLTSLPPCMSAAVRPRRGRLRPVIASIRGSDSTLCMASPYFRPLLLQALGAPQCWVTSVNQLYLDEVGTQVDLTGRSSVMRNGAPALTRQWQLTEENRGVVGSTGDFRKVKDIPLMVRAFCQVPPELRRKLLLVGQFRDPGEQSWSWTLLEEAGLLGATELTGFLSHPEAVAQMARMNMFVQSSAFEGMPNTLMEAAAFGLPIVATAVGGVKEIFTDGKDALLVPHAEPAMMARAMARVIESPALAQSLADGAAQLCETYSRAREREAWVGLHQRLLEA